MNRIRVLNVQFDSVTIAEAVQQAVKWLHSDEKKYIVTPNAEIVLEARKNQLLSDAIRNAGMVLPDGVGVVRAARSYRTPLKSKVAGIDFASALCEELRKTEDYKLFLLGAQPGVAELAKTALESKYPGLIVGGTMHGYYDDEQMAVQAINDSGAKVVFVCLGSPKQEIFMMEHQTEINANLLIGLGGSLDVFSGKVKRAPVVWQKLGMEWLYRLLQEPKRLGRILRLPKFQLLAWADAFRSR